MTAHGRILFNRGMVTDSLMTLTPLPSLPTYTQGDAPAYTQAQARVYPDRPVYRAGKFYSDYLFVPDMAIMSAMSAPKGRVGKAKGLISGTVGAVAFKKFSDAAHRWQRKMRQKHPKLAEWANRHPLLAGMVFGAPIFLADLLVFDLAEAGTQKLLNAKPVHQGLSKALHSQGGNMLTRVAKPVYKALTHPLVQRGMFVGVLALLGWTLLRGVQDSLTFKRAYKKARKQHPIADVSPSELRFHVATHRAEPRYVKAHHVELGNAQQEHGVLLNA